MADKLQTGIVWVNDWLVRDLRTPFGGVKSSGVGREGGWEALRFFTEAKNIFIKYSEISLLLKNIPPKLHSTKQNRKAEHTWFNRDFGAFMRI